MSLRKASLGVPLHRRISSVIEDAIATGRHQPGERLPYTLSTVYLPPDVGGQLDCNDFATTPLSELLQRVGRPYGRIQVSVGAILADPVLAEVLQVKVGDPLVDVHRLGFDAQNRPIEYQTILGPPTRYRLHATLGA